MARDRRDKKNRVLWNGEYQKSDGRYEYRYTDAKGVNRSVYSWTLTQTDKPPKGKKSEMCLREIEKQIERDMQDEIDTFTAQRTTLNTLFEIYIEGKQELKQSTRTNYKYMYESFVSETLGKRALTSIKYSDIKNFYNSLIQERKFKPNSMEVVNTILHPVFGMAVRDGYIRMNPTDGVMKEIKKSHEWETTKREALTLAQQNAFMNFVNSSDEYRHWSSILTVLLGTGGRIGEIIGLRWCDCDFDENIITIDHNLIYRVQDNGKCEYHVTTPKTKAGTRKIPMLADVRKALLEEHAQQKREGFNLTVIDGYTGFIFKSRYGSVQGAFNINRAIKRICRDYNKLESERAKREQREPLLLPNFSAHNLRHTFCTRMCENTSDKLTLKVIQEIMGHSDISTTLNIYTDLMWEQKQDAFFELEGKLGIG